jgi:hypothetical protein
VTAHRARAKPTGFFVLRTPLLPFDELLEWTHGLDHRDAEDARAVLRERLRGLLARPEIAEALYVASPDFHAAVEGGWPTPRAAGVRRRSAP